MPGTILENLSGRKLSVLVGVLLSIQIACFLVGGLVAPPPSGSHAIYTTACLDSHESRTKKQDLEHWVTPDCHRLDLEDETTLKGVTAQDIVFVAKLPIQSEAFSRWQQNLVGVLEIDMVYKSEKPLGPVIELTLDSRLAYKNKRDKSKKWHYLAHAKEKRYMDCTFDKKGFKEGYPYNCSSVPLFELGSLYHDFYLLNLRLPIDSSGTNSHVDHISEIQIHIIHMNGGFTMVWLAIKTFFFPVIVAIMIWFWNRVHQLSRTPVLLEYMLVYLGVALMFLNLPLEYLTLFFDMPYTLLLGDIRQGIFYAMLLSFWMVFAGEHMLIQNTAEKNSLKKYWKHLSAILIGCVSLLFFDLSERGVQLYNPFFSIWVTPIGANLALAFIILAGISACMYFIFLCYMIWRVFKNISIKRTALPSMSSARRLHYEGIIYRFNFLMLATLICAAVTIFSFIMNQIIEGQTKWDDNVDLEMSSAIFTGVYGMWNVYICAMLILYAPSHKQWPSESVCGENGEEVEFSCLPTECSPNEISSLTSFASKAMMD